MKSKTRLDSAVFQLTPTRTRYTLVINAKGRTENISSGLLKPFLAHLKTAQDQVSRGCYSIMLVPNHVSDALWFTKDTVERFVRFVNTPEVLERVNMTESEILQIQEAIAIQNNDSIGSNNVKNHKSKAEDYRERSRESTEGALPILNVNAENTVIIYKLGGHHINSNGSIGRENTKIQFLRVLETRKTVLQKEQGMAFARALAAGFDMDRMVHLISFAECFGAPRLREACLGFMVLWKGKHGTGNWFEIEATDLMPCQSELSSMNTYNTMTQETEKHDKFKEASSDSLNTANADMTFDHDKEKRSSGHQELCHPLQGMPCHQNHLGSGTLLEPPYPQVEDPRVQNSQTMAIDGHFMVSREENTESKMPEMNASCTRPQVGCELEKQSAQGQEQQRKAARIGRKKSGVVFIRNINYLSSERRHSRRDGGSQTSFDPENSKQAEDVQDVGPKCKQKKSVGFTKGKEIHTSPIAVNGPETDSGNWQVFQNILLRHNNIDELANDQGMLAQVQGVQVKRQQNRTATDSITLHGQDPYEVQDGRRNYYHTNGGKNTNLLSASSDEVVSSRGEIWRGDYLVDSHLTESEGGRGGYKKPVNNGFVIYERTTSSECTIPKPDSLAVTGFAAANEKLYKNSLFIDESFILPPRSSSKDKSRVDCIAINMDAELPSGLQKKENVSSRGRSQLRYEPDDLSLMPICGRVSESIGYDPAVDCDVKVCARSIVTVQKRTKENSVNGVTEMSKKSNMDRKSKGIHDNAVKRKNVEVLKLNPSTEDQAREERIIPFKVDLQKMKKSKEEAEMKRLEALKEERQKRITARSSSGPAQLTSSSQTRPQVKPKLSPTLYKGLKSSDSKPGTGAPLQRFSNRTASLGSSVSQKVNRPSNLNKPSQSILTSQIGPQLQTQLSPISYKGSKFTDSEPGPSSPLQRLRSRAASLRSNASQKITRPSGDHNDSTKNVWPASSLPEHKRDNAVVKPEMNVSAARIQRLSASSLPEIRKDNAAVKPEMNVFAAQIRRLSDPTLSSRDHVCLTKPGTDSAEPKVVTGTRRLPQSEKSNKHQVTSTKVQGPALYLNPKETGESGVRKISTIVGKGKSKFTVLPVMKDNTLKCPSDMIQSKTEQLTLKRIDSSSVTPEGTEVKISSTKSSHNGSGEDKRVIETTVVLETELPLIPVIEVSGERIGSRDESFAGHRVGEKTGLAVKYAAVQAPYSPTAMKEIGGSIKDHFDEKQYSPEVAAGNAAKELPTHSSIDIPSKPHQSPCVQVSSFLEPRTPSSEHKRVPPISSEMATEITETPRAHVSDFTGSSLDDPCIPNLENTRVPPNSSEMATKIMETSKAHAPPNSSEVATKFTETPKAHASDFTDSSSLDKTPGSIVEPRVKRLPKGIRRILRFGRISGKNSHESDRMVNKCTVIDNCVSSTASSKEGKKVEARGYTRASMSQALYIV